MDLSPSGHLRPAPRHRSASPVSQGLAAAAVAIPITGLAWRLDQPMVLGLGLLALAGGIAVGMAVDLERWLRAMTGLVTAVLAMLAVVVVQVFLASQEVPIGSYWVAPFVGLMVVGLDWRWTPRLQAVVVASGVATLLVTELSAPTAPGLLVIWSLLAAATLWSLRRDSEQALSRPVPLTATEEVVRPPWSAALGLVLSTLFAAGVVALIALVALPRFQSPADGDPRGDGAEAGDFGGSGWDSTPSGPGGQGGGAVGGSGAESARDVDGDGVADEFDVDGDGTYDVDRNGNPLDGGGWTEAPGSNSGSEQGPLPGDRPQQATEQQDDDNRSGVNLGWILAGVIALALVAGSAWWAWRRHVRRRALAARPWPVRLAERIDDEGARRGRARRRSEPITHYTSALVDGVLPDPRLSAVGARVSAGLFSRPEQVPDDEAWATDVLDQIAEAHPVPRPWHRFTRDPSGTGTVHP